MRNSRYRQSPRNSDRLNSSDLLIKKVHNYFFKRLLIIISVCLGLILIFGTYSSIADTNNIKVDLIANLSSNNCLTSNNNSVSLAPCHPANNQNFVENRGFINANNLCLSVQKSNHKNQQFNFNLQGCSKDPSEVWLVSGYNLYNPLNQQCLNASHQKLSLAVCSYNSDSSQNWHFESFDSGKTTTINGISCPKNLTLNQQISCQAMLQWNLWHQPKSNHLNLLNKYTDGFGLEEWCADFVSYIYKASGQPFTNGERNNWDEYNANYVANESIFTQYPAQNYTPRAGDVAFFDYPGGHVEIVIVGGQHPTFIYGDSANLDPQTGNGDMAANTITKVSNFGQVTYYLSPN
jgi:hypothetical protein